jgi:multiple sugar transport system substrate-binding protein
VRFGVPPLLGGPVRAAATAFNQAQTALNVTVTTIDGDADSSPTAMASQFDCFVARAYEPAGSAALDLQPLIDAAPTFDAGDYPPVLLEQLREDGALVGVPLTMELPLLIYNTERFAEAGIAPPSADWTLDDMLTAAEQLTSGSGAERRFGLGAADAGLLRFFLERSGVEPARDDGQKLRPRYIDPAVVAALQRFVAVVQQTTPSARMSGYSANPNDPAAAEATQSGRVAMWLGTTNNLPYAEGSALPVALAPLPPTNEQIPGVMVNQALYIAANNPEPAACWRWIQALSASEELGAGRSLPARRSLLGTAATQPGIREGTAELAAAYSAALAAPAGSAAPWERSAFNSFWLIRAVDRALQGGDLERELADAQFLTEQYLNCAQGGEAHEACARAVDPTYVGWGEAAR